MNDSKLLAVGLMSGTSLDGIDAAMVELGDDDTAQLRGYVTVPFDSDLVARLRSVAEGERCDASTWARLGIELAAAHAVAVRSIAAGALRAGRVDLVAAHGVTVSHRPTGAAPHSLQLLDGAKLAAEIGVPVVADFRVADVARGGQGAPLAPLADFALRRSSSRDRVILNLGGIANLTAIPAGATEMSQVVAADVGPANMVLDETWRRHEDGTGYDAGGERARQGTVDPTVVDQLLTQPWVRAATPRSFGREQFGPAWVDTFFEATPSASLADRLATLIEAEARAVHIFLDEVAGPWRTQDRFELYVTGGGRHNGAVMDALARHNPAADLDGMEALGVDPDAKEAMDFAWLGGRTVRGIASPTRALTGAREDAVLGVVYPVAKGTP